MIAVLCDSYQDVLDAFDIFCEFMETYFPFAIRKIFPECNRIDTDDDLVYIFVDKIFERCFDPIKDDILVSEEFFEDLELNSELQGIL